MERGEVGKKKKLQKGSDPDREFSLHRLKRFAISFTSLFKKLHWHMRLVPAVVWRWEKKKNQSELKISEP